MKKLLTYLIGLLVPIMSIAQAEIPEGLYYIVSASNGPGYYSGSTPPETNYNFENMYALYNSDGIVKWKTFTRGADQEYYISPDGADGYYIKSVSDESYIQAGKSTINCDVLTSAEPTSQELVSVGDGKYAIKNARPSCVYALKNSHNGPTTESGNLSIWGTVSEAERYGVNVWYLVPIKSASSESKSIGGVTYNFFNEFNLALPVSISEDVTEVNINHSLIYNENEYTISYLSPVLFSSSENLCSINVSGFDDYESIDGILYKKDGESLTVVACPKAKGGIISLPENVRTIGNFAFSGCTSLTSIEIPNTVTSIGSYAFDGCSSLTYAVIGESVTSIGNYAFSGCTSLTSIEILSASFCANTSSTKNVVSIFGDKINKCIIGEGVKVLGSYIFSGCSNLEILYVPSTLQSIENFAFSNCSKINEVHIGSVKSWVNIMRNGGYTYPNNNGGNSVKMYVGEEELVDCVIPDGVTEIPAWCFDHVKNIASVTIGDDVATVGNYAFRNCTSLTSVVIGHSVSSIGSYAFWDNNKLNLVINHAATPQTVSILSFPSHTLIAVPGESYDAYKAADGWSSFATNLQIVPIEKNYYDMTVNIEALDDKSALHMAIGEDNLEKVVTLKITGTINSYDLMILRNKMIHLKNLDLSDACIVANDYEYYTGYHSEDNILGTNAFYNCALKLNTIKLPRTLIQINPSAFMGCTSLISVESYEGIESIGNQAFNGCSNLVSINLPNSIKSLGTNVFNSCGSLESITLPENITRIPSFSFAQTGLKSVFVPKDVKAIDSYAFSYCSSLNEVIMPATLDKIDNYAFQNCTNLETIKVPSGITKIGNNAFAGCNKLNNVYTYTVEPTSIDMNTFATFTTATLWVPEQSYYNYYYDTQWSKFLTLKYFNEPYEYFYINKDYEIQESTGGAIDGAPDADINEGSGLITKDDVNQELGDVHVKQDADTNEGGSIIAEGESTITGNKIYHDIKVSGGKWYFFSFPFNVKISDIICGGQYIFREYDGAERAQNGTGNSWKKLPADQEYLEAGKGYIFHTSKAGVLSLPEENAEISAEDKVLALEVHASANSANASWNFIGNPNTSYYDMDDMKFGAPITVWDSKTQSYVAYRPGDDNYQLAPYEAFFVQTSESAKNVEFDAENQQTHKEAKKNKENKAKAKAFQPANPTRSLINLTITGANGTDKTRVVFNDDKALAYEAECDAAKFLSDGSVPQIYSHDGQGVKYAINERPNADGTVMLGFISTNGGDYTIEATRSDIPVLLKDNETGAVVNITDQAYNFTAKSGTFDNRFLLVQDYDATGIEDITAKTGVEINVANGAIEFANVGDNKIKVFDIAGSLVVKAVTDKATVAPGIYVVKVGNYATKVSVK